MASSDHNLVHSELFGDLEAEYAKDFSLLVIKPERMKEVIRDKTKIGIYRTRYAEVEVMTKVPWYFTGAIHLREADQNFHAWLYNGDPMYDHNGVRVRTVHVPRGLPRDPNISWEAGAVDTFRQAGILGVVEWSPARLAWAGEKLNGFGYRLFHRIPTPYLWGGTNVQQPGKYTRDKHFDPTVMDEQVGIMAIFKLILEEGTRA